MRLFPKWSRFVLLLITSCGLAASTKLMGDTAEKLQRHFQVEPGDKLTLESDIGSIDVTTTAEKSVNVEVQREARASTQSEAQEILRDLSLDFRQKGRDVFVKATYRRGGFWSGNWGNRLRLRFCITVPQQYNVDLKTGGGSIRVSDLEGSIVSRTSGGILQFGHVSGSVWGHTSGGSINVAGCAGPVTVDTSGGSIRIGRVDGPVHFGCFI